MLYGLREDRHADRREDRARRWERVVCEVSGATCGVGAALLVVGLLCWAVQTLMGGAW
jgi:hypothetical protein